MLPSCQIFTAAQMLQIYVQTVIIKYGQIFYNMFYNQTLIYKLLIH